MLNALGFIGIAIVYCWVGMAILMVLIGLVVSLINGDWNND